jgi:two-component system, chemotaxis family, sensor kinase CheA
MDKDALRTRLMATFLGELEEHVQGMNRDALALEKAEPAARSELVRTLFRRVHSLKGAARSVDVSPIEAFCHRLEEMLAAARDGASPLGPEQVQVLLSAADALQDAGKLLRDNPNLSSAPLNDVLERRGTALSKSAARPPSKAHLAPTQAASTLAAETPPNTTAIVAQDRSDGFMRVAASKLDSLLAQSGELLFARRRVAARENDVSALLETMEQCAMDWRRLEKPLRLLMRADVDERDGTKRGGALSGRALAALLRTGDNLKKLERGLERLARGVAADHHALEVAAAPLESQVRGVRMLPFREACEGLERVVRDVAHAGGKELDLHVDGAEVELDRSILEQLKDPLLQLVRNAVDHGMETPAEREARGKPARGRLSVSAAVRGAGVEVAVADDGAGLDLSSIREQARRMKIAVPDEERELARLVFLPGFSTAWRITERSGRGVGLDVVKHHVERLRGTVDVRSEPGRGTRFVLNLPLTLTTLRALLFSAFGQVFAIPAASVRRLVRVGAADISTLGGREVVSSEGRPIPLVSLARILSGAREEAAQGTGKLPLVIVAAGERLVAFAVDELVAEQEIVVKPLGKRIRRMPPFSGTTLLPTGRVALLFSAPDLVQAALTKKPDRSVLRLLAHEPQVQRKRLLVVDDSVTTRSLERSILEAAGYEVLVATDGADAWRLLQETAVDLVVSDVEMPRMDGFLLTQAIRAVERLRALPVVLVTALESESDRARGLQAGADAYLPKSSFDQTALLGAISQLV